MDDSDSFVMFLFQGVTQQFRSNGFAEFDFQFIGLFAVGDSNIVPALGKGTIHAGKHAFLYKVANAGFLHA
ncbi:hypothetical protein SDC9_116554 [bioreactor metagenome]|uniref:Uncharacterized protein n=1 Tax=bioreactor metagenome TaxID=1076179 RepID=A0A645BVS6_9ZZZZ